MIHQLLALLCIVCVQSIEISLFRNWVGTTLLLLCGYVYTIYTVLLA